MSRSLSLSIYIYIYIHIHMLYIYIHMDEEAGAAGRPCGEAGGLPPDTKHVIFGNKYIFFHLDSVFLFGNCNFFFGKID